MARRTVAETDVSDDTDVPAGDFSSWLIEMQGAIRGEHGTVVPCGGCTACCTSSQFIHVGPDETRTLARIPPQLLFPAPRMPPGHVLLGYDERGHCPMLVDNQCSIYEHRPRACRTYDCRIFPAAGLELDDDDADDYRILIAERAKRWRFSYPTETDRDHHDAVRAAATLLQEQTSQLRDRAVPTSTTQLAVRAVEAVRVELTRRTGARDGT